ncbi:hypothetical protein [Xanthomonas phage DES1]|nr:hypothetical protein [Xanthomonas phage DES1]
MTYNITIEWHKDERDWLSASDMEHHVQEIIRKLFLEGYVKDVTIEEDDE